MNNNTPIRYLKTQPVPQEPVPVEQSANLLRTLIGVSLGAAVALAADWSPVFDWLARLV